MMKELFVFPSRLRSYHRARFHSLGETIDIFVSQYCTYIVNLSEVLSMCMQVQGPLPRIASQSVLTLTSNLLSSKSTSPKLKPVTISTQPQGRDGQV